MGGMKTDLFPPFFSRIPAQFGRRGGGGVGGVGNTICHGGSGRVGKKWAKRPSFPHLFLNGGSNLAPLLPSLAELQGQSLLSALEASH